MQNLDERTYMDDAAVSELEGSGGAMWFNRNFNPWNVGIDDCMIRSVSAALLMKYQEVCRHLGLTLREGLGIERRTGVSFTEVAENKYLSTFFEPVRRLKTPPTLKRFLEIMKTSKPDSLFVCLTSRNGESHAVCCCSDSRRPYFVDTWDCSENTVDFYARVVRQTPPLSGSRITKEEFFQIRKMDRETQKEVAGMLDYRKTRKGTDRYGVYSYDGEYAGRSNVLEKTALPWQVASAFKDVFPGMKVPQDLPAANLIQAVDKAGGAFRIVFRRLGDLTDRAEFQELKLRLFEALEARKVPPRSVRMSYHVVRSSGEESLRRLTTLTVEYAQAEIPEPSI